MKPCAVLNWKLGPVHDLQSRRRHQEELLDKILANIGWLDG